MNKPVLNPQALLAAIVESSDDAIITKDLNGIITSWNQGAERMFGYTADEAVGMPVLMLIPEDRQDEEPRILARLRSGLRIDHFETVRRHKDGTLLDISLTISPVKDAEGKIIGASKIARDITAQKAAQGVREFLAAIVDSSEDAILSQDSDGFITSWNKGAEKLFGHTAAEMIGKSIFTAIPAERHQQEHLIIDRIRKGDRIEHYETARRSKDGTLLDISIVISPLKNAAGQVVGASKIARDITQRKRAERELQQARENLARANEELEQRVEERTASLRQVVAQLEEFSYSVSHDLRAPVRAMKGYALALLEDHSELLDTTARGYVERIVRSGTQMENLIHDILTYSRLARLDTRLEPVSVGKLASEIIQQYPALQEPKAEIILREPLLSVQAHEPSLIQALSNLLHNAVKFVAPGTKPVVEISTMRREERVRIYVKDNGIGIKPEYQHRLFGLFERIHQEGTYEGTGIGLAIVRKAAEKMGGSVGVESDGVHGTTFWIELTAA